MTLAAKVLAQTAIDIYNNPKLLGPIRDAFDKRRAGFTYKSRFAVEEWVKHFRADFDKEPRATFFEVPIIGGMAKMGKWFIDSGMRRGTPKDDHEHVITVYSGAGDIKKRMDYKAPDAAYLLVLDPQGKVAWKYTGPFTEDAYAALAAQMKKLLP